MDNENKMKKDKVYLQKQADSIMELEDDEFNQEYHDDRIQFPEFREENDEMNAKKEEDPFEGEKEESPLRKEEKAKKENKLSKYFHFICFESFYTKTLFPKAKVSLF
jgi:hypothetical protein